MIDHLEISTRKLTETVTFYGEVLAPLGYGLVVDGPAKGFGHDDKLDFWVVEGDPSTDVHYAFNAVSRAQVHDAFDRSNTASGRQDRAPALAPHIHPGYYAGYARDPDGRLVEFVCHAVE